jgi:adenylate kinase family enzyme
LLLLTGPAGAGKTTVADQWARAQAMPTLHLSLDDMRDRVKAGYANPEAGITPTVTEQLTLARTALAAVAKVYLDAGYQCVLDDAVFPGDHWAELASWLSALAPLRPHVVVLAPSLDLVLARNTQRTSHRRLTPETVRAIYELMAPWRDAPKVTVIDTTGLTVEQSVVALDQMARSNDVADGASYPDPLPQRSAFFGSLRGRIRMADDFDAPLADFSAYMPPE